MMNRGGFSVWLCLLILFGCCRSDEVPVRKEMDLAEEARADLKRRNFRALSASLESLLADEKFEPVASQWHPQLHKAALDFTLLDSDGREWTLSQKVKSAPVLLVFYNGYICDHCVSQLFALNEDISWFRELGVQIAAISSDPPELTRKQFQKYKPFHFPALSDPDNKIAEKYEVYLRDQDDLLHGTFVIDRQGLVAWTKRGNTPFTDNRTLLYEVARAEGRLPAGKK